MTIKKQQKVLFEPKIWILCLKCFFILDYDFTFNVETSKNLNIKIHLKFYNVSQNQFFYKWSENLRFLISIFRGHSDSESLSMTRFKLFSNRIYEFNNKKYEILTCLEYHFWALYCLRHCCAWRTLWGFQLILWFITNKSRKIPRFLSKLVYF